MKNVVFIGLSVLCALLADQRCAHAEFSCQSQVSYTVESLPSKTAKVKAGDLIDPKEAQTPHPTPTPAVSIVSIAQIEAKGEDEAKAKAALQKVGVRLLEKARITCREKHENVGGCISAKFEANATALRSLDFSVRKALEESLRSDCEVQRGRCKGAELKDIVCAEIVVAAPVSESPVAEAAKDEKKKGKK